MRHIGLIGVGLLGTALAERFLANGFRVVGFDAAPEGGQRLKDMLASVATDAADVANDCRRIVLCLPDADVCRSVVDELRPALRPGTIVIDTTTGDPGRMIEIGEALSAVGVAYLDATVGGSSAEARAGEVIVMVGGDTEAFNACADAFASFSRRAFHVGPVGSGARMKLVVNLVLGLNRAVLAEGLGFARSLGLDLPVVLEVLRAGPAASRAAEVKGEKMIAQDFAPQARLAQHFKDVELILAQSPDARLPFSALHAELLKALIAEGCGDLDNSAIVKAFA